MLWKHWRRPRSLRARLTLLPSPVSSRTAPRRGIDDASELFISGLRLWPTPDLSCVARGDRLGGLHAAYVARRPGFVGRAPGASACVGGARSATNETGGRCDSSWSACVISTMRLQSSCFSECAKGDKEAFVELFRGINRRVFLFAKHRLGDREDAEEVLNDTAMELWQHPDRFRGDSRFMTYVLGIANNKASSLLRSRGRFEDDPADDPEDLPNCESAPYETVWRKQKLAAIAQCMERLPERQRTIVYLAYFEDLSREEIGRIVDCEENAVRQYLHQALRKMRGCLAASEVQ